MPLNTLLSYLSEVGFTEKNIGFGSDTVRCFEHALPDKTIEISVVVSSARHKNDEYSHFIIYMEFEKDRTHISGSMRTFNTSGELMQFLKPF